ncbi:hypothetical protein PCANC_12042 [Puccinia coronata f. sp. avenae]|uniref:Cyclin N-terminal domain-containing protein n=2 Tax=Puccinia coronata f. sp. avenae TaxID=200324 RepID=A0A2N5TNH2_9BASI|nr:hypothetical protein PCANC_22056 [Puccinia coronata f. sp. avenae]PLW41424.1 hypothetical protein PCANC_12042 [Puccinia coronata f. sp. avenae]
MSWSPTWAPSGLSPTRNSTLFDLCHARPDGSWTNAQTAELLKFSMNLSNVDRHQSSLGSTVQLPPIYGHTALRRSSPLSSAAVRLSAIRPAVVGYQKPPPPAFPRKSSLTSVYSMSERYNLPSPMDSTTHFCPAAQVAVAAPKVNPLIQPFNDHPYSSPTLSPPHPARCSHPVYTSNPPKRSKAALATEDWDHPSFARPPHRAVAEEAQPNHNNNPTEFGWQSTTASPKHDINPVDQSYSPQNLNQPLSDEPLVPSVYPVPPPPPYEQSAAPLSDLAADIVWERCYFPKPRSSLTAPPPAPCHQLFGGWPHPAGFQSGESPSSHMSRLGNPSSSCNCAGGPANNNTYGVIGAEAKARRFNRQYPSLVSPPQSDCSNSSAHSRKPSLGTTKMEVKPAFRRWTRQVLENTLLSPQVLILALYYIESVAGTDVFGDTTGKMSLLPYKMLLAALVVANKTLDDHSYRNSTFANVSSMTNAEVNAVEVALLKALKFDVVPTHEQWTHWLQEVITAGKRSGLLLPDMGAPRSPLSGSSQYHHQPQQQHQHQHVHPEPRSPHSFEGYRLQSGSIFDEAPARDTSWHTGGVDPLAVYAPSSSSLSAAAAAGPAAGFYWSDPRLNPPPAPGVPSTSDALRRDSFVRPGTFRPELAPPAYNNHASLFPPRVLFPAYSAHH